MLRDGRWRSAHGNKNADQVAVSPFDPQHIDWANENSGQWWQSRDGGTTSVDFGNERRAAGESAWLSDSGKAVYHAQILFDPLRAGRLWIAEGVGINYCALAAHPQQPMLIPGQNEHPEAW